MRKDEVGEGGIYGYLEGDEVIPVQILGKTRWLGVIPYGWRALDITTGCIVYVRRAEDLMVRYDTTLIGRAALRGRGYIAPAAEDEGGSRGLGPSDLVRAYKDVNGWGFPGSPRRFISRVTASHAALSWSKELHAYARTKLEEAVHEERSCA